MQAIRVKLVDLDGFEGFNNKVRWVGPATQFPEKDLAEPQGWFTGAALQCEPHFSGWGTIDLLHIYGAEIVPSSTYDVQLIDMSCAASIADDAAYSAPLTVTTQKWGDVIPPFFDPDNQVVQPDFADIGGIVDKLKGLAYNKRLAQLQPNTPAPTKPVDFLDISACVDAFKGLAYPYDGPTGCPP